MRNIILALSFFGLVGCAPQFSSVHSNQLVHMDLIKGSVNEVLLIDKRVGVTSSLLKIPNGTFPGMKSEVSEAINNSFKERMQNEVKKHFSNKSAQTYKVEVILLEGLKGYKANAFNEVEYANIKLEINVIDSNGLKTNCTSTEKYYFKSYDAKELRLELIYQKIALIAIHNCFEKISNKF